MKKVNLELELDVDRTLRKIETYCSKVSAPL